MFISMFSFAYWSSRDVLCYKKSLVTTSYVAGIRWSCKANNLFMNEMDSILELITWVMKVIDTIKGGEMFFFESFCGGF
jgi:hypothetical protein